MQKLWPRSLLGQMLLSVALALFFVQGLGAALVYRAQRERMEAALIHTAAFRILMAARAPAERRDRDGAHGENRDRRPPPFLREMRSFRPIRSETSPLRPGEAHDSKAEAELRRILAEQDTVPTGVVVTRRDIAGDSIASLRLAQERLLLGHNTGPEFRQVLLAGVRLDNGKWLVTRVFVPPGERELVLSLAIQTLVIYVVLVGAIALILRRITRPLAALTRRLEHFAEQPKPRAQMVPEGPDDVRRLIVAHNAMEARISGLLDEKDVMLGAIGHDLKTPLAALRVRIESVEDDIERDRMARTIEDIVRSLDDILSLARVGRPSDPLEQSELSAFVISVVEEYEDMGEPVELGDTQRIVLPLRATWLRRALRNLIGNALRYGQRARVSLRRTDGQAVVRIEDDGPGIPPGEIDRMLQPFTRGEPSRNTVTGGAGLGLTLARAIAEQHGGALTLENRVAPDGSVLGLTAELRLPLA